MADDILDNQVKLLRMAAEHTRLKILFLLDKREHYVGELTELLGIKQTALSHHLGKLRNAGVINGDRRARLCWYSLSEAGKALVKATRAMK